MKYLLFIFFLTNLVFVKAQNCNIPKDGKYSIEYDDKFKNYPKCVFEIKGNDYYQFENDKKKDFKIIKISDCIYKLENKEVIDESKLTDLQKKLIKQQPYFEIQKVEGNVYYFVCREDLHVLCYSGKFIKE